MLPRLDAIETDLLNRRQRAEREGWLGEIEGIDLTRAACTANAIKVFVLPCLASPERVGGLTQLGIPPRRQERL